MLFIYFHYFTKIIGFTGVYIVYTVVQFTITTRYMYMYIRIPTLHTAIPNSQSCSNRLIYTPA